MEYVYIIKCSDNTLYTGYTNNLDKRIKTHNLKKGAKYTRSRTPVTLMYYETYHYKSDALKREYQIKNFTKKEKEILIKKGKNMKKILVVIDMQNDFVSGSLGTNEAKGIVNNVISKIKEYDPKNIYATRDTHFENYLETSEGKSLPVEHCIKGTYGHEIIDELKPYLSEATIIDKPTFGSVELAKILHEESLKNDIEIELVGLCTDICVVSNALLLKAYMPEAKITVDSKSCAGVTPESHNMALNTMKSCQIEIK